MGAHVYPHPELPSHLSPHPIPLGSPRAPTLSALLHALNLHWSSVVHVVMHMFQCYSLISSHPRLLPHSPKVCSLHLCLFGCLAYRVIITIFLNSIYMRWYTELVFINLIERTTCIFTFVPPCPWAPLAFFFRILRNLSSDLGAASLRHFQVQRRRGCIWAAWCPRYPLPLGSSAEGAVLPIFCPRLAGCVILRGAQCYLLPVSPRCEVTRLALAWFPGDAGWSIYDTFQSLPVGPWVTLAWLQPLLSRASPWLTRALKVTLPAQPQFCRAPRIPVPKSPWLQNPTVHCTYLIVTFTFWLPWVLGIT